MFRVKKKCTLQFVSHKALRSSKELVFKHVKQLVRKSLQRRLVHRLSWVLFIRRKLVGTLYVSGNLPTNPSPKPTFCPKCSLHSKRFRASLSRKLGREQKKRNEEGGGRERRKRLPANPTILKNCVRPRTQLLIGAVLVVLIK